MALGDSKEVEGGRGKAGLDSMQQCEQSAAYFIIGQKYGKGKKQKLKNKFGRMGTAVETKASSQGSKQSAGREAGPTCHNACLSYNSSIHVYTY